jgi:hypothetical protein
VHGHFFNLTDAERLRATAFDTLKAGVEITGPGLIGSTSKAIESRYEYEYVEIPVETDAPPLAAGVLTSQIAVVTDAREMELRAQVERVDRLFVSPTPAPAPVGDVFVAETEFDEIGVFFDDHQPDPLGRGPQPDIRDDLMMAEIGVGSFAAASNLVQGLDQPLAIDALHEVNPVMTDYIFAAGRL